MTPRVTGHAWMGVSHATHALFPGRVIDVPADLDGPIGRPRAARAVCRDLVATGVSQVILSGFPPAFGPLAVELHRSGVVVGCLFHGAVSECGRSHEGAQALETILRLTRRGVITKLACTKPGLPETISPITGVPVHTLTIPTAIPREGPRRRIADDRRQIGVLGGAHDPFGKNVHAQVAAALLVDEAVVHVPEDLDVSYWDCEHRLVRHPTLLSHDAFTAVLGDMDVNLHLSFSESWGQVTAESLARGIPCLTAPRSGIYDHDAVLREVLVSDHFDNPWELSRHIHAVLDDRPRISPRCRALVADLNRLAAARLDEFLHGA